jgi:hypothetical protein
MRTPIAVWTLPVGAWAEDRAIPVGPWTIATSSRRDKFDSCTMSRSTNDLDVSSIRDQDGLILLLESSKWRLERGHAYPVTLVAGSWSVDAKALAETKGVTIALTNRLSLQIASRRRGLLTRR